MLKSFSNILMVILTAVIFSSCKTITPVVTEKELYSGEEIFQEISNNMHSFRTYSARRMRLHIDDNTEELNLRGSVRIQRDSAVMISINAFAGIEVARIMFEIDSVRIIDRINNVYFQGSYEKSIVIIPFISNYEMIESLFLGPSPYIFKKFDLFDRKQNYLFDKDLLTLHYNDINDFGNENNSNDEVRVKLDPDFLIRSVEIYSENRDSYTRIKYASYGDYDGVVLPEQIDLQFTKNNIPFYASFNIGRIHLDDDLSFPFNIPSGYRYIN